MRVKPFVVVAILAAMASPGLAQERRIEEERISRSFRLGSDGRVELSNIAGDIVVTGGGGDTVAIEAMKRTRGDRNELATVDVRFEERPGRLSVHTVHPSRQRRGDHAWVDLTVTVPRDATLDLHSVSGSLRVTGVRGRVRAQTVSGAVAASDSPRVEEARSVSGSVELNGTSFEAPLEASTVSGVVRLRDVKARTLTLGSVSGDVEATNVEAEHLEMKSVSGDLTFAGGPARNGRYELNSHSGDIAIRLGGGAGFEFAASTFSGSIRSDIPATLENTRLPRRGGRNQSLRGVVGDGGAIVQVTTFSGDILLERR